MKIPKKSGYYWWKPPELNGIKEDWQPVEVWNTLIDDNFRVSFIFDTSPNGQPVELLIKIGGTWGDEIREPA